MSGKLKKSSLEKALVSALSLQKQLFDNKAEVDYDFLVTINKIVSYLEVELKYARLKGCAKIDASSVDRLESTLFEFDSVIRKVCKEKRIKRYMQSTRVRRKLDQLNNSAYAIVRALVRAAADVPIKKEKEKTKDKKKAVKDDRFQILTVALTDADAKRMWEDNWAGEVRYLLPCEPKAVLFKHMPQFPSSAHTITKPLLRADAIPFRLCNRKS
jgi:hypothetical protein